MKTYECIGCGFCCYKAKCVAGQRLYSSATICPLLLWNGQRYVCDLMSIPGNVGFAYRKELYAGEGCCMNLNTWRQNIKERNEISQKKVKLLIAKEFQIFLYCLGREWLSKDVFILLL
jgi:hypothetical protein